MHCNMYVHKCTVSQLTAAERALKQATVSLSTAQIVSLSTAQTEDPAAARVQPKSGIHMAV